jgi:hypothetical protein
MRGAKWAREQLIMLRAAYGDCCAVCGLHVNLEFHHVKPTGLNGPGRGMQNRAVDILKHRDSYILLCNYHHMLVHRQDAQGGGEL